MLTDLHSCIAISQENEKLKERVRKLKYELRDARNAVRRQEEVQNVRQFLNNSIAVQTDVSTASLSPRRVQPSASETPLLDRKRLERMQVIYKQLLRRYEKEKQENIEKAETVTMQNLKVRELELKLREKEFEVDVLRKENVVLKEIYEETRTQFYGRPDSKRSSKKGSSFGEWDALMRSRLQDASKRPKKRDGIPESVELSSLSDEMARLRTECEQLRREKRAVERELGQLDPGFFEELEDLKFSLAESKRLNADYDRFVKQLSRTYRFELPAQLRFSAK